MDFLIVTGMSGAGKSNAADCLEDVGYYCVDNIPPMLIPSFVELSKRTNNEINKIAIVTDIRGGELFKDIEKVVEQMKNSGTKFKILFLDASTEELLRRYKENRRSHPLSTSQNLTIDEAIASERATLKSVRNIADYIIDTTHISANNLKEQIINIFLENAAGSLKVQCMSFGFKYGPVSDADLVFDVRCLPNPFYIDNLRALTGLDEAVSSYVMGFEESKQTFSKISDLIDYMLPLYFSEGKSRLVIAFGCTGGKHRSVTFAEGLAKHLKEKGSNVHINHRDINRA
ncbi:MAG: RNase adapter RapZ [Clostridia bacterium]|nr:RNase adapter RapZ [Clostridia bacterium]